MHYIARPFHPFWFHQRNIRREILKLLLCSLCPFMLSPTSTPFSVVFPISNTSISAFEITRLRRFCLPPPFPPVWSFMPYGNWNMRVRVNWSAVVVTMSLFTLRERFCPSLQARNYIYCRTILGTMPLVLIKGKPGLLKKYMNGCLTYFLELLTEQRFAGARRSFEKTLC
jgi:hypothetical protein